MRGLYTWVDLYLKYTWVYNEVNKVEDIDKSTSIDKVSKRKDIIPT